MKMTAIAAAYLVIATSLLGQGKAMIALPMPDIATCQREAAKVRTWNGAANGLIGAMCVNAAKQES